MTFQLKKRINAELFIDGNKEILIQKVDKETRSKKITDLLEEGKTETPKWWESKWGNETRQQPFTNDLLVHERKDKPMAACLKRLWAWKAKNIVAQKIGYLSVYYSTWKSM